MSLDEDQIFILLTITNVLGWTSFIFNTLIFIGYGLNPKSRQFPSSIFWYALIPSIVQSAGIPIGTFTGNPAINAPDSPLCSLQALFIHYGYISWCTWVFISTIHLYLLIVKAKVFANPERTDRIYLMLGFVLPVVPVLAALIGRAYGSSGGWCYVSRKDNGFWMLFTNTLLIVLLALGSLIMTTIVVVHVQIGLWKLKRKQDKTQEYQHAINSVSSFQKRLITFISLFCAIFLVGSGVRIRQIYMWNTTGGDLEWAWSVVLTCIFGLTGIIHLLAYGTNKSLYVQACKSVKRSKNQANDTTCCV
eukprot:TRINITY_DN4881_c0_g1_i1.p1 TRINITY_DN4881_c0_g1~~TRINITY_DN4881_c0_g1_i1.p1  ORF type:complete len:305 (+),score=15.11 TRINITY_DN4881_c0_g1_i1:275-1189(+)